jgi:hypothetical protein
MLPLARNLVLLGSVACLTACGDDGGDEGSTLPIPTQPSGIMSIGPTGDSASETGGVTDPGDTGGSEGTEAGSDPPNPSDPDTGGGSKFDIGVIPDGGVADTGAVDCDADPMNPACMCTIPDHVPCDGNAVDPFQAMGLNCPGELQVMATKSGDNAAIGVRTNFGQAGVFVPREGSKFAVIGSGLIGDLDLVTPQFDNDGGPTHCNDAIGSPDNLQSPPNPIKINPVGGDCVANPALVGTGDCSGTIQDQFSQGGIANDYTELRFTLQVPEDVVSFSYDFAFFSVEYPYYYGSQFNDMYIGWLESEKWTGNISFDQQGNPISLNAGFLEFTDDGGGNPVFGGTCMRQHAGTNWLTTTAGVTPGETITVVFAIFDLADAILDSYAFIDNFKWGCDPQGKPMTMPPG